MTAKVIHPRMNQRVRNTLMASAMLLAIAACGSDSTSSTATSAPAAAATTPAAAATTPAPAATTPAPAATTPATAAPAATTAASPAATTAGTTAASGTPIAVTESEFKIDIPSLPTAPGTYTFNITNSGKFHHNLVFTGPGITDKAQSPTVEAGQTGSITVTLQAGSYDVFCGIPTHKGKGMDMTLTIA